MNFGKWTYVEIYESHHANPATSWIYDMHIRDRDLPIALLFPLVTIRRVQQDHHLR